MIRRRAAQVTVDTLPEQRTWASPTRVVLVVVGLIVLTLLSLGVGRYWVGPDTVVRILAEHIFPLSDTGSVRDEAVVLNIRLPRILGALLVGAALASSGAAYQTMLRNPLVSPEILGVAAGAGFGASLGILLELPESVFQIMAFGFGLLAALASLGIGRVVGTVSPIVLVLGGVIVGAIFSALISLTQYFADPETALPAITFWLFGSLGRATMGGLLVPGILIVVCLVALFALRWPLTVLATDEEVARTLGVNRQFVWTVVILGSTLMTATVVSIAGIIGWVGLVIPHLARAFTGPSFGPLLTLSTLLGAGYLLAVDDVARTATALDIPLGILTALVGGPFFVALLMRAGRQWL